MDFSFTFDPTVIIIYEAKDFTIYFNLNNESWLIYGQCDYCGSCIEGAVEPDLRLRHERLDIPVRPEISETPHCKLRGVYV